MVYKLSFIGTSKVYVGQSKNIESRLTSHLYRLKTGSASKKLQAAFIEFGYPSITILKECEETELNTAEVTFIHTLNSINQGFNTSKGGANMYGSLQGEAHPSSKYTNGTIVDIFNVLVDMPELPYKDISEIYSLPIGTISSIASGAEHCWLKELYPDRYTKLMSLIGGRVSLHSKYSSKYPVEKLLAVFKLLTSIEKKTHKEISSIPGVSINTIASISCGRSHKWLAIDYPIKYEKLVNKKLE